MKQISLWEPIIMGDTFREICHKLNISNCRSNWPEKLGESITKYLEDHQFPKIRTLSLFSGAGGLDIGFEEVGFDIIESVELEKKFCETLVANSGSNKRFKNSNIKCT